MSARLAADVPRRTGPRRAMRGPGSPQRIGADSSDATYRSVLRTHVYPVIGDRQIRMIRREEIKEIIATMSRKGLSPSRTAVARLVINAVRALDHTIWLFERDRRALPQTGASSSAGWPASPQDRRLMIGWPGWGPIPPLAAGMSRAVPEVVPLVDQDSEGGLRTA